MILRLPQTWHMRRSMYHHLHGSGLRVLDLSSYEPAL